MSNCGSVKHFYGIIIIWICLHIVSFSYATLTNYDKSVLEDAQLDPPGLLKKYGYPVEIHKVETKDGFILAVHRIPKPGAQPVLLVHGLGDTSYTFLRFGPSISLGYLLSQNGYDVWLINSRGNRYSRTHKHYHPNEAQFWDFSFHEVGIYDQPATIDYILAQCKDFKQIHFVGHSQGTTTFFAMGSERPEYMKKVILMHALAPVVYFDYVEGPIVKVLAKYVQLITMFFKQFGIYEFPPNPALGRLTYNLCTFLFPNTCVYFLSQSFGMNVEPFNVTLVPVYVGHSPTSTSVKSLMHYGQQIQTGGFYKYDYYNPQENLKYYGSTNPPKYNLSNVNCKVALYYGTNDLLGAVKDVEHLLQELPNVVRSQPKPYEKLNHIDFVWGTDAQRMVNEDVIRIMQKVDRGEM